MAHKKASEKTKDEKSDTKDTEKKGEHKADQDLSEEDKQLQDELNMPVEWLTEPNQKLCSAALESLWPLIRASTTSMTSVPKPLKFLRVHYDTLKGIYETIKDPNTQSEEDKQLQDELNMLVEWLTEPNQKLYFAALESLRPLIRASTTSMTSVPKPLKFLRVHYDTLKGIYETIKDPNTQRFCADIVSVLGMTMSEGRDSFKYRLLGSKEEIGSWGHEYVRHLARQVAQDVSEDNMDMQHKLVALAKDIVPYHMSHNAQLHLCTVGGQIYKRPDNLKRHIKNDHTAPPTDTSTSTTTNNTTPSSSDISAISTSQTSSSSNTSTTSHKRQNNTNDRPAKKQKAEINSEDLESLQILPEDVRVAYTEHWSFIRVHHTINLLMSVYTVFHQPENTHNTDRLDTLNTIFESQTTRFKINYSHHIMLRCRETADIRFFNASSNKESVLDTPKLINNRVYFEDFIKSIHEQDILDVALYTGPNTKYIVETIPATSIYIYHIKEFPKGCCLDDNTPAHHRKLCY